MKELKLRVWDSVKKKMYKPLAVSFDIQTSNTFAVSVPGRSWEPVHKFEISQSTGLVDLKGNEAFDGDIIEISSLLYLVNWNDQSACYELQEVYNSSTRSINDLTIGEIVGNKYENKDLVEEMVSSIRMS